MLADEVSNQLLKLPTGDDFAGKSAELMSMWSSVGAGLETLEPILRFMEANPSIDYGVPGALVHFVERFAGPEYERKLIESVDRKPVLQTVWMLNRLINATRASSERLNRLVLKQANAEG